MKINDVKIIALATGGSVLVMPMSTATGERVVHVDVEAYDDDERVATISLTHDEAVRLSALFADAARALEVD